MSSGCNLLFKVSHHLKSGAPGTVWTWTVMMEFAMLSSMTGSPRYLFSIQGVSKSQTGVYVFCRQNCAKLSTVFVRCAPVVTEWLCISQNNLFVTRFVRWAREGSSALQVWTLVWGLPGPGRGSCLRAWNSQAEIWANFGFWILCYVVPAWLWFYTTQYCVGVI